MEDLKRKRSRIKGNITRVENFVNSRSADLNIDINELTIRESLLTKAFDDYDKVQEVIEDSIDEQDTEEVNIQLADREGIETRYIKCLSKIKTLIQSKGNSISSNGATQGSLLGISKVGSQSSQPAARVKLPNMNIPTFGGNYGEWRTFIDLFTASIHSDETLMRSQKFMYLKSFLKDEPLSLICELKISEENYDKALTLLKSHYDRKMPVINYHINGLLQATVSKGSKGLREFTSQIRQHINALEALDVKVLKSWDLLLINIFSSKLDRKLRNDFELERDRNTLPTMEQFFAFLDKRSSVWEIAIQSNEYRKGFDQRQRTFSKQSSVMHSHKVTSNHLSNTSHSISNEQICIYCKGSQHNIYRCGKFISSPIHVKREFVLKNKLCFNCLGSKHMVTQCTREKCKTCAGKHHTLLHENRGNVNNSHSSTIELNCNQQSNQNETIHSQSHIPLPSNSTQSSACNHSESFQEKSSSQVHQCSSALNKGQVLLATAKVNLISENGNQISVRALLDSGSQSSFVTTEVVKRLSITPTKTNLEILGISQSSSHVSQMVHLVIESNCLNKEKFPITCGILNKITCELPQTYVDTSQFVIPSNIILADKHFNIPGKIDMLIGADLYYELIVPGLMKTGSNSPSLQNSKLGWILGGMVKYKQINPVSNLSVVLITHSHYDVNEIIPKFWQLEEISITRVHSAEDKICEKIFTSTTKRTSEGKFSVNLPLKDNIETINLGDSFEIAKRRCLSLERRLGKNKELYSRYKAFIDEYINLGHGVYVPLRMETEGHLKKYFLPHHCVIREESVSTKLRVVFDASMPSSSGFSLNDLMYKGPTVQADLFDIVCRFRTFRYVLTSDIIKMYRQVQINFNHRHLQNILWRDHPTEELKCIELQTVSYGTNCAPFLATRSLVQLANENTVSYPLASQALLEQCYVDDILAGSNTLEGLSKLRNELVDLLDSAGFHLHKWVSNVKDFVDPRNFKNISLNYSDESKGEGKKQVSCARSIDKAESVGRIEGHTGLKKIHSIHSVPEVEIHVDECLTKVLGLSWQPSLDIFKICSFSVEENSALTKRNVLSHIARLFDPLGFLSPVVIIGKILMQKIWVSKIGWDDILPDDLGNEWKKFSQGIPHLSELDIPRLLFMAHDIKAFELHGFSDASIKAYGACFYLRTIYSNGEVMCRLICSKSRVAPLRTVTLPRLELCGFLLMARLYYKLCSIFCIEFSKVILWSDSKIVLSWLQSSSSRWTTFVANRVSEIQEIATNAQWKYVPSSQNPADHISRGLNLVSLISCKEWWNGPDFLYQMNLNLNENLTMETTSLIEERSATHVSVNDSSAAMDIFSRFSKFSRLQRTIGYCLRFINNCSTKKEKLNGCLSVEELQNSLIIISRCIQGHYFAKEIKDLKSNILIKSGPMVQLSPFLDSNGIVRVTGRLSQANLSFSQKHPIILPPKDHVVKLLYRQEHLNLYHAGPQNILAHLRLRFWPLNGLRQIKKEVKNCVICHRFKAATAQQIMGSLPSDRVSAVRPFLKAGVDFGGPIFVKETYLRNARVSKAYIALFVCMVTKAIHIELVSSLTTEAFILTLKRFIARRGCPHLIFSDNGTNFQGANNLLKDVYHFFKENKNSVQEFLSTKEIKWKFIPPNSPHWGGLWEAGIKSTKFHLKRVIGNCILSFEQISTLLCQIEAILNSRPLSPISTDPKDYSCLTPSHFLIGDVLTSFPEKDISNIPDNRLKAMQHCQKIRQGFWKRWSIEYLNRLQHRPKWTQVSRNLKQDDLVLVKEDNLPPLKWHFARVSKIMPGKDGKVRVVEIRTQNGIFIRPITKLCPLPFSSPESDSAGGEDVAVSDLALIQ